MIFELWPEGILACFIACLYPFFLQNSKKSLKIFFLTAFFATGLLLSSRSLCLAVIIISILKHSGFDIKYKKIYTPLFLLALLLVCLLVNLDSVVGRLFIWMIIIKNCLQIPLNGFGFETFKEVYGDWQIAYFSTHNNYNLFHKLAESPSFAFNELFHFYIEFGIVSILIIATLIAFNLKIFSSKKDFLSRNCALSNLVIFLISLISYPMHSVWILCILLANHTIIILRIVRAKVFIIALITGSTFLPFLYLIYKYNNDKTNWQYAAMIPNAGLSEKETLYYKSFLELNRNQYFLNAYSTFLLSENNTTRFFEISKSRKKYFNQYEYFILNGNAFFQNQNYDSACIYFEKAHLMIPSRFIPTYYQFKIAKLTKKNLEAKNYALQIIKRPVKIENQISINIKEEASFFLSTH